MCLLGNWLQNKYFPGQKTSKNILPGLEPEKIEKHWSDMSNCIVYISDGQLLWLTVHLIRLRIFYAGQQLMRLYDEFFAAK